MTPALQSALSDLSQNFGFEAEGHPINQLTREAVIDGSVALDARNFNEPETLRTLVRNKMVTKWGDRADHDGIQYYILTAKGYDTLFPA